MNSRRSLNSSRGFTLLEVMIAIAIIGILAVAGIALYSKYISRAKSAEIAVKYDAIRTSIRGNLVDGVVPDCAALESRFSKQNLPEKYATLSYGFEAVPNGFRPVLSVCATVGKHQTEGVQAARAAHDLLASQGVVEKGAVLTDSAVSFALRLTANDSALCKTYATPTAGDCTGASASASAVAAVATAPASTPTAAAVQPVKPACTPTTTAQQAKVPRQVMTFDATGSGFIMNEGDLDTGGDMRSFTIEVAVLGSQQAAAQGQHAGTMLSYATRSDTNAFQIWNPRSVGLWFGGRNYDTGLDTTDGRDHRITVTWESATGSLTLFDNGRQVWTGVARRGESLGGNGKLVLGQDQDSYGGGFDVADAYQGKIVAASVASRAVSATQVASGPVQAYLPSNQGLVTSVTAPSAPGQAPTDSTGRHRFTQGGSVRSTTELVDRTLYVTTTCN